MMMVMMMIIIIRSSSSSRRSYQNDGHVSFSNLPSQWNYGKSQDLPRNRE